MRYGARVAAMAMHRAALVDVLAVRAACQQLLGHLGQSRPPAMSNLSGSIPHPAPHAIAVYASRPLSPVAAQHSLPSGRYSLLGPDLYEAPGVKRFLLAEEA